MGFFRKKVKGERNRKVITESDRVVRVNRSKVRSERGRDEGKVQSVTESVSRRVRNQRMKVKLIKKVKKTGGVVIIRSVHLNIEISDDNGRSRAVEKNS